MWICQIHCARRLHRPSLPRPDLLSGALCRTLVSCRFDARCGQTNFPSPAQVHTRPDFTHTHLMPETKGTPATPLSLTPTQDDKCANSAATDVTHATPPATLSASQTRSFRLPQHSRVADAWALWAVRLASNEDILVAAFLASNTHLRSVGSAKGVDRGGGEKRFFPSAQRRADPRACDSTPI
jgi:hypothetical protein